MIQIRKPNKNDIPALVELAKITFLQSHGHSASKQDIQHYIDQNYTPVKFEKELADSDNSYHLLWSEVELVGYSNIKMNQTLEAIPQQNMAKLDRIYLLESYHGLGLGEELLNFNIQLAKSNQQTGIWLYTWVENKRAIRFYEKKGFKTWGKHNFKVSPTHSNPNWVMALMF